MIPAAKKITLACLCCVGPMIYARLGNLEFQLFKLECVFRKTKRQIMQVNTVFDRNILCQ